MHLGKNGLDSINRVQILNEVCINQDLLFYILTKVYKNDLTKKHKLTLSKDTQYSSQDNLSLGDSVGSCVLSTYHTGLYTVQGNSYILDCVLLPRGRKTHLCSIYILVSCLGIVLSCEIAYPCGI